MDYLDDPADQGVYMIRNLRSGESYIGQSRRLENRLRHHHKAIRKQTGSAAWCKAFPSISEVEFRVLEFLKEINLREREEYWIARLRPTVNVPVACNLPPIEDLPVGPPPPSDSETGIQAA